jgi:tryptophan synthase alpha chain
MAPEAGDLLDRVRRLSRLPVAVGFGISRPEHVAEACRHADAAVVGSALVNVIAEHEGNGVAERAGEYVRWLKSAL